MARPKKTDEEKLTRYMSIRVDAAQHASICAAAKAMTMEPNAYVRWAAFTQSKAHARAVVK